MCVHEYVYVSKGDYMCMSMCIGSRVSMCIHLEFCVTECVYIPMCEYIYMSVNICLGVSLHK